VLGMITGAGFAHNFALAGGPDKVIEGVSQVGGIGPYGMAAVILGLVVCLALGFSMRERT
ncbi:MAG: YedE-related selenium metabolism membrane protein, partial [Chloroflexi bacterium]|nr:YedE-related selenium metabolism membrane protein [Chloroflexota bacterium]